MRTLFFVPLALAAGLTLTAAATAGPSDENRSWRAPQSGIRWETSLEKAQAKAQKTGKPLFVLHMFGKLTDEFC